MKLLLFALLLISLVGCGNDETDTLGTVTVSSSIPSSFFTAERPDGVKDLVEVKKTAKKGDEVTFLARIGGRKNASFVPTLAMMIIADPGLISCEIMSNAEDHCATPEDYCCEDPELYAKGLGTVRFMDEMGDVYPFSVEGAHGLEILKYIVVKGTVNDINENGLFIVDANKIWVGGKPRFGDERAGSGE